LKSEEAVMRTGVFVYISGPISPRNGKLVEENVAAALHVFLDVIQSGIPAFCPHLQAIYPSAHDIDYDLWMDYDYRVIDRCTHMLCMEGWETSNGAALEYQYARAQGIPVAFSIPELILMLEK